MISTCVFKILHKDVCSNYPKRCFTLLPLKFCKIENTEQDAESIKKEYDGMLSDCLDPASHRCYVVQPWVKWGAEKVCDRTPAQRLHEAALLCGWLRGWTVTGGECLGIRTSRAPLGSGQLRRLADTLINLGGVTALVMNVPLLGNGQVRELNAELPGRPKVYDRAGLVLRLVREQVIKGTHAHAQLELAELEYVTRRCRGERERYVLGIRRTQLMTQLETCKEQRKLHRKRRQNADLPIVAVIGYTNAGKSSLVSALVGSDVCVSSERAFHTLEVIGRAGELPSGLRVIYMDTVGFLSDIPTLVAPLFTATLEDVLLADVLLHVVDTSHEEATIQKEHVENELHKIYEAAEQALPPIITVGNKLDVRNNSQSNPPLWELAVSALRGTGVDALRLRLQDELLRATGRTVITLRLPEGSDELRWMYKNAVVLGEKADMNNPQSTLVKVIITEIKINQFYSQYIKKRNS